MRKEFFVAGVKFREEYRRALKNGISEGDQVGLIPEPTNQHDSNAIAVYWRGYHIGYVPAPIAANLVDEIRLRDKPNIIYGTLTSVNPEAKPWKMFKVEVEL
jgi:hypothetical protein